MRQSQPIVILIIIVMAIILAAGSFLALMYIQGRPDSPVGTSVTVVEGIPVTLNMDPVKEVRVLGVGDIPVNIPVDIPTTPGQEQPVQEQQPLPTVVVEVPTPLPAPTSTPVPNSVKTEQYLVQQNDSLYGIARRVDTSIALMARYGISQDDLVPGQTIDLPVGNPAYCPGDNRQPYAVGEGDTAFSIGRKFNITADELKAINNLDENHTVYGASIICVPR